MNKLSITAACAVVLATAFPATARTSSVTAVSVVLSKPTAAARKLEIGRQVASLCNLSLSSGDLDRASAFIEANRARGAHWVAEQISRSELGAACGE
jgi:hypothetical protein